VLCSSPPADDDDAYCIAMARREAFRNTKYRTNHYSTQHHLREATGDGNSGNGGVSSLNFVGEGAFVLSNDFYRDAMARDSSGDLERWLKGSTTVDSNGSRSGNEKSLPPGRISYFFCDLGSMNEYGDHLLDFIPNPRHLLIERIEKLNRK